jgi:regulator of protease activity HflC (stomatin/prohibitin superfamily)
MAAITSYPFLRHLRAEPTAYVLRYRRGRLVASGTGLAFWFRPLHAAVAELPVDDRELPFLFRVRSADFQDVTVQGAISFRVADPTRLAQRVDFTVDLESGRWQQAPLEQVAALLTQLAQQFVIDELARAGLRAILARGVAPLRERIAAGLAEEPALAELGLQVVAVRVAAVTPAADVEQALRQPTHEAIQQQADEATFARRALAVEKERAIAENELQNRIELARREEQLVARDGANQRRRAEEEAAALKIEAAANDERGRLAAHREADTIDLVEAAKLRAERERADIQGAMPPAVLLALALRQLAGELGKVEHLTITPDLVAPLIERLAVDGRNGRGA